MVIRVFPIFVLLRLTQKKFVKFRLNVFSPVMRSSRFVPSLFLLLTVIVLKRLLTLVVLMKWFRLLRLGVRGRVHLELSPRPRTVVFSLLRRNSTKFHGRRFRCLMARCRPRASRTPEAISMLFIRISLLKKIFLPVPAGRGRVQNV